ncbi:uroporphyrinogen-III synthase [Leucothrix sargassi]|nr:uroporphyrinogen-III synthase [Leucothrix sargassi]
MHDSLAPTVFNGCGFVITRPAHQTQQAEQQLTAAGGEVLKFPLLEIAEPSDTALCQSQLNNLATQDCIIFTSANAVEFALAKLATPLSTHCNIAAVGKKTAQTLKRHGITANVVPEENFNSEALLALPELQQVAGQKISIIRGEGGRALLKETLTERGAEVSYIDVYQRRCPQTSILPLVKFLATQTNAIILITSEESLHNLFELTRGQIALDKTTLLVGSQRIAQSHVLDGFKGEVLVASDPSDNSLYKCLLAWANQS